jgi:hypothetical protein
MTKIASMVPKIPRGKIIGKQIGGPPLSEAEHFWKCQVTSTCAILVRCWNTTNRCRTRPAIGRSDPRYISDRVAHE